RHARGVELTDAGKVLVADAQAILLTLGKSLQKIEIIRRAEAEPVRLGVTANAGRAMISSLMASEARAKGRFRLVLIEGTGGQLLRRTQAGELDAALGYDVEDDGGS